MWRRPRSAILDLGAVSILGSLYMAFSLTVETWTDWMGWLVPGDFWLAVRDAQYVADGAVPYIYELTPTTALPLYFIFLAPFYSVGRNLGLVTSYPGYLPYPSMWILLGPVSLALGYPLVRAVRHWSEALSTARADVLVALALWLAFLPCAIWGHFEDVLALAFLVVSLRGAALESPRSPLMLGLAIASKQWAVLALPLLLVTAWRRRWPAAAVEALAVPGFFAVTALALDWKHASTALLRTPNFPIKGHVQPWVDRTVTAVAAWPSRLALLGVVALVIVALRRRYDPATLCAGLAVCLLARSLFEPVVHSYYLAPGLLLAAMHEGLARGSHWRSGAAGTAAILLFYWADGPLWWPAFVLVTVVTGWSSIRHLAATRFDTQDEAESSSSLTASPSSTS